MIFMAFYIYYVLKGKNLSPEPEIWLFPLLIVVLAIFGLGVGMIISSLTTKYRDFRILIGFATTLLMYVSAVMYPLSEVENSATLSSYSWIVEYNPIALIIEAFRYMTLGEGYFNIVTLSYCTGISILLFLIGLAVFNRTGKNFIDTI